MRNIGVINFFFYFYFFRKFSKSCAEYNSHNRRMLVLLPEKLHCLPEFFHWFLRHSKILDKTANIDSIGVTVKIAELFIAQKFLQARIFENINIIHPATIHFYLAVN